MWSFQNQRQNVTPLLKTLHWLPMFLIINYKVFTMSSRSSRIFTYPTPTLHLCQLSISPFDWLYLYVSWPWHMASPLLSHCIFCSLSRECFCYRNLHNTLSHLILLCWKKSFSERSSLIKLPKIGRSSPQTHQLCIPYPALLFLACTI